MTARRCSMDDRRLWLAFSTELAKEGKKLEESSAHYAANGESLTSLLMTSSACDFFLMAACAARVAGKVGN
jgi:hypothetical protein